MARKTKPNKSGNVPPETRGIKPKNSRLKHQKRLEKKLTMAPRSTAQEEFGSDKLAMTTTSKKLHEGIAIVAT